MTSSPTRSIAGTAFDTATYVSVIDWKADTSSIHLSRAASDRRARLMDSEDRDVRMAAAGYIAGMSGSNPAKASILKNSRLG